jgi:outer membrane protein insertion porin family
MPFPFALTSLRPVPAYVALVAAAAVATSARAVEPFKIGDIRIEGLQRGDPGSVFGALPFRIGDEYNDDKGAAALRALFATGLFKDVRIDIEEQVVVIVVEERSLIASVNFLGLREFDKDTLTKALKENGISEGQPYDKAVIDRAEQEIKRQYLTRSLYGAEVVTTATPIERNRVNITFTVVEGDVAKIKDIRIEGAKAVSDSTLLGLMDLTTGGWLTWYTKSDRYSRAHLNSDLEKIRAYYLNKGYLEFDVKTTQVTISPDKQEISILISIDEGQPYTVTGVKLEGEYLGREEDFKRRITIKPGEPYRQTAGRPRRGCPPPRDDSRLRRPVRHVRLCVRADRASPGHRPQDRPGGDRAAGQSWPTRECSPSQHCRQLDHPRRGVAPRVPPIRIGLVRRREDQAVARARRAPGLLR